MIKRRFSPFAILLSSLLAVSTNAQPKVEKGSIVLTENFEAQKLPEWKVAGNNKAEIVLGASGQALQIQRINPHEPSAMVSFDLPVAQLRGCKILIEAQVKAESISAPPQSWNGIKVMLHTKSPSGDSWPQQNLPQGTFDWQAIRYRASVPEDATEASLALGLEAVTGKVWFDNVKVSVLSLPRTRPKNPPTGPRYKGHQLPCLRGAMISTFLTEQDLRDLRKWNANHVRWQVTWNGFPSSPADNASLVEYEAWLESALKHLDSLLPVCRELGIHVLIDLHTPPGGRTSQSECRLFKERHLQSAFVSLWEKMARRYKDEKIIWGYDLVNEPVEGDIPEGLMDWHDLALETAKRVRAIDSNHAIIIEAAPWGGPGALADFEPLPLPDIVYSFHMYEPHEFTHQNVYNDVPPISYPGIISGKKWDIEQLRRTLQPVINWQRDYNVHVYVGEFSAIRWAPDDSAYNYLRDCTAIFEENGWDWAYHAFREWPGWSVEHTGDKQHTELATTPTSRQKLLEGLFAANQH